MIVNARRVKKKQMRDKPTPDKIAQSKIPYTTCPLMFIYFIVGRA